MGIFDRFKHDKKSDDSAKEQVQEQAAPGQSAPAPSSGDTPAATAEKYAGATEDAVDATKEAADRLAASARIAPEPKAEAPAAAAPAAPAHRTYTVKPGDSLSAIARHELNNESRWHEIYDLNRAAIGGNPDLIQPGTELKLP
ncbi:LysM peptidoglycan-binding domain-containing protein [Streptomyces sp. NBC_01304]|uniref:LysM peptidoglycan-binding domain-containing protein n=1 Tax=Streptomyces sp. NBC_01304 TaxID=2903818 RepID=UPI002E0E6EF0|nr:LysM peptidoglycan-binding domain-containing protein [Streptomyces sp. NBC_01304]